MENSLVVLHLKPTSSDSADRGRSIIRVRLGVAKQIYKLTTPEFLCRHGIVPRISHYLLCANYMFMFATA